jgi:hypothetical protein
VQPGNPALAVLATGPGLVQVYDLSRPGAAVGTFAGHGDGGALCAAALGGGGVATGGGDGRVRVWDPRLAGVGAAAATGVPI